MAEEEKKPVAKKAAPKAAAEKKPAAEPAAKKAPAKKPAAPKAEAPKVEAPKAEPVIEEAPKAAAKKVPAKKPAAKPAAEKKPAAKKTTLAKREDKKEEPKPVKAPVTEATCVARDIRVTPRKMRLVADYVRGRNVNEALALLKHLNKSAALPIYKAIKSAAANATNNFNLDGDLLYVAEIQASDGKKMKRYTPRAKGSASPVWKRMSHLRVVVKERR